MYNLNGRIKIIFLFIYFLLQATSVQANSVQEIDKKYEITANKITDQVFVLSVAWSETSFINSAIVVGDKGVMLITAQMLPVAPSLEAKIRELTGKPVTYVLNMASDTFHYHANDYFKERGAELISHKELQYSEASTQTLFDSNFSMQFGSELVTATYTRAHTKGQTIVYLKNSNVMLLGDAFRTDKLVYTGYHGVEAQLSGFAQAYEIANDQTLIVSGHKGEQLFSKRHALKQASATLNTFSKLVGKKHKAGMTLEQMISDKELQSAVNIYPIYQDKPNLIKYNIMQLIETEFTQAYNISDSALKTYVGSYQGDNGSIFKVDIVNGNLFIMEKGKFLFKLTSISKDKFYIWKSSTASFYMQFHFSSDGKVIGVSPKIPEDSYYVQIIPTGLRQKL
jgi:cyclase